MAYILDNKKNTSSYIVPVGSAPMMESLVDMQIKAELSVGPDNSQKYTFPAVKASGLGYILQDTLGDGNLAWVPISDTAAGDPSFEFMRITDSGVDYVLDDEDHGIEIVSDTYTTVTLPTAAGIGGRVYFVSRGSDTEIVLTAQTGETIDGLQTYTFHKKYTHLSVMSNGVDTWYVL